MRGPDTQFLEVSCGLAEYFIYRLETLPPSIERGRMVPLWDFDAPLQDNEIPLRDSSAGMIAANGMLVLAQALASIDRPALCSRYQNAAFAIVEDATAFAVAPERAYLRPGLDQAIEAAECSNAARFDAILKYGTANNNANARKRYATHGLVYGDYYFAEFGNRLLRSGRV